MNISLVITILNEESTLDSLFKSIQSQSLLPNEIIIVDGGSTDKSLEKLELWKKEKTFKNKLKVFIKKGNRSIGRNFAIQKSKNNLIAITDAGCTIHKNWLKKLSEKYKQTKSPVIAGYYQGIANSNFEEAVIPYVLVMPDRVNPNNFLPATRSMLIEKKIWKKVKKFNEKLDHNEDYDFAKKIEKENIEISFTSKAIVNWIPRKSLISFIKMIFRFAYGDAEADILRPKVLLILLRYFLMLLILFLIITKSISSNYGLIFLILAFLSYCFWSILKNKKYTPKGWYWLPILQLSSDLAIVIGTISGSLVRNQQHE
jgi:glycosyltransferase involved in cell wall biosynthesis